MPKTSVQPSHGSYLLPHLNHATVADAMHPGILSCDAEATLPDVARVMATHHVHCVVVGGTADGQGEESPVLGIVSDVDVLRAGMRPDAADTASELARQPVIVETTSPLRDAAELMLANSASHVVAVNPLTKRPVGILSTLDVAGILGWGEL
jgi:CBS domain-containing protein